MSYKIISILLAVALLTACSTHKTPSQASGDSVTRILPAGALLLGFNRNDDYVINRAEFENGRDRAFTRADVDGNGVISVSEFRRWQPQAMGASGALPHFISFDRNFDDRITQAEFIRGMEKIFNHADKNNDLVVSNEELVDIVLAPMAERRSYQGKRGQSDKKSRERRRSSGF